MKEQTVQIQERYSPTQLSDRFLEYTILFPVVTKQERIYPDGRRTRLVHTPDAKPRTVYTDSKGREYIKLKGQHKTTKFYRPE